MSDEWLVKAVTFKYETAETAIKMDNALALEWKVQVRDQRRINC